MAEPAPAVVRPAARWGTAAALGAVVLFNGALDPFPLVVLPLATLLLGFLLKTLRATLFAGILLFWVFALTPQSSGWSLLARGWALALGGLFVLLVLWRPRWPFFPRALLAIAATMSGALAWLFLAGTYEGAAWAVAEHFRAISASTAAGIGQVLPDSSWAESIAAAAAAAAPMQAKLFPALLALQSLAALGLAWWAFLRLGTRPPRWRSFGRLRNFRFNDQLVWVMIAGLLLVVLPLGSLASGAGVNTLVFMGGLYAVRGLAVFVFLAGTAPSIGSVLFGVLATIFLYPLVLTGALLVGLGDTWLDVRTRAAASPSRK